MASKMIKSQIVSQDEIETGMRKVRENSKWQGYAKKRTTRMGIRQGLRRRNPKSVLHNFAAIQKTTTKAESTWEKSLTDENDRQKLDKEFHWKGDNTLMANQMGIAKAAADNFNRSKFKLERAYIVGV